MKECLAQYDEKRLGWERHFELYPDHVFFRGRRGFMSCFEGEIALEDLRLPSTKLWTPDQRNQAWLVLPALLLLILWLVNSARIYFFSEPLYFSGIAVLVVAMVAGFFLARRTAWRQYRTRAGVAVLEICAVGQNEEVLDEFCGRIDEQIRRLQATERLANRSE